MSVSLLLMLKVSLPQGRKEALCFGWVLLVYWFVNNRNVLLRVLEAESLRSGSQHG